MAAPTIPLFPLNTVLFPDGLLPLRVFEVRYLDMIAKAIAAGNGFGVVPLLAGAEIRKPGADEPRFAEVGTIAAIAAWSAPQTGLLEVMCDGTSRFRLLAATELPTGLWMGEIELLPPDHVVAVPDELANCAHAFEAACASMRASAQPGQILPFREPLLLDDCGWLANRWCELLPLPVAQKARLLELDNPLLRLELIQDALEDLGWLDEGDGESGE
jgi:Lon protease-like protein